jgi:glutamate racemase
MIGIFDSGVGGLTVLRKVRELLPSSDVVYFGDTRNAPYGMRSREELTRLTVAGLTLLRERGAQRIISACNSVSASLAISLYDALSILPQELIEMVGPTVSYFRNSDAQLVLCATPATVDSQIYQNGFRMMGKEVECVAVAQLAGAIELGAPERDIERIIAEAFAGMMLSIDAVLILACTHYPLVIDAFRRVLGESVLIFDPAYAVAERAERQFWPQEVGEGRTQFFISKESAQFRVHVAQLFPDQKYSIEVLG